MTGAQARYVVGRIAQALVIVVLTYTLVFAILYLLPGDPIASAVNDPQNPLPQDQVHVVLAYYNLDRSGLEQYLIAAGRALHGDFGYSLTTGQPVARMFGQALPHTASIAALAFLVAVVVAFGISVLATHGPTRGVRAIARAVPSVTLSVPSFLLALVVVQVFAFRLGWFSPVRDSGFKAVLWPALVLGVVVAPHVTQVFVQGVDRTQQMPFVLVLRAQGRSGYAIFLRVVKNAVLPTLTLFSLTAGELLAGSVIVEVIFNKNGIGQLTQDAVRGQDTPVILLVVLFVSTVFVTINLLTDLVYPWIDPRISLRQRTRDRRGSGRGGPQPASGDVTSSSGEREDERKMASAGVDHGA
ncbi:peptide ABC transporter permease [Luteimicrobium album]|uniref:Peptide ABC transporter permease n=1 Tax=Luteimicrobium album TaxID=1054550 RepID=A0ABQ6I3S2_9MICO|nr:ABC transporter permease [Luteimicrobium album]GMA24439.1 peptide ABC transporter permease [Luteimicrobium album]